MKTEFRQHVINYFKTSMYMKKLPMAMIFFVIIMNYFMSTGLSFSIIFLFYIKVSHSPARTWLWKSQLTHHWLLCWHLEGKFPGKTHSWEVMLIKESDWRACYNASKPRSWGGQEYSQSTWRAFGRSSHSAHWVGSVAGRVEHRHVGNCVDSKLPEEFVRTPFWVDWIP